jgi:cytochrome o ubiquinol oxidase subunit 3
MTITNSILGTTFFTLTGTHGTHVAIGVFWLLLMYVRSFQPQDPETRPAWFVGNVVHILVFIAAIVLSGYVVIELAWTLEAGGLSPGTLGRFARAQALAIVGAVASLAGLVQLARTRGPYAFGEANAIDVEMMGLYWHFVDIVWIVIFTAVYLLEYI